MIVRKKSFQSSFRKINLPSLSRQSSHKLRRHKIFNFLMICIENDVFVRKFTKRFGMSVNIRNFKKWTLEISANTRNFTNWIEIYVNIRKFTKWIQISVNIRNLIK